MTNLHDKKQESASTQGTHCNNALYIVNDNQTKEESKQKKRANKRREQEQTTPVPVDPFQARHDTTRFPATKKTKFHL